MRDLKILEFVRFLTHSTRIQAKTKFLVILAFQTRITRLASFPLRLHYSGVT